MSEDVKINVSAPGAKQAAGDLQNVARAEGQVGRSGRKAGKDVKQGAGEGRAALDQLGGAVGVNTSMFLSLKTAAAGAAAALVAVFLKALQAARDMRREWRQTYREFAKQAAEPGTRQLAQIRDADEAATAKWVWQQARAHGLRPEDVRSGAFEIESGFAGPEAMRAIGGKAGVAEIEQDAFRLMRTSGASGRAVSGLAIAGYEAGVARTPEGMRQFFARAQTYAASSRVSLEQLADVAGQLLPAAVKAGISEAQFMSMAAAMSFRLKDPGRLRTAIEQMIRAAGTGSGRLDAEAAAIGRVAAEMSAVERMALQADVIAAAKAAGGLEGGAAAATELGIPPELAQTYASAYDAQVRARMGGLQAAGGRATWQRAVADRYARVAGTKVAAVQRTAMDVKLAEQEAGESQAMLTIIENEARAAVNRMMAGDEDIPGVLEDAPGGKERAVRRLTALALEERVRAIMGAPSLPAGVREEAWRHRLEISAHGGEYQRWGFGEGDIMRAGQFVQRVEHQYNGGNQYINADKRDPAGRPRKTGME